MAAQVKTQIIDQWHLLTPSEAVKKLLAIVSDLLLTSAENMIIAGIEVLRPLADEFLDLLDKPVSIPVLAPLYKEISGNDLSVLDLGCLVAAVPATVTYKILRGRALFPDNAETAALMAAPDWPGLQALIGAKAADAAGPPVPGPRSDARGGVHGMMAAEEEEEEQVADLPTAVTVAFNFLGAIGAVIMLFTNGQKFAFTKENTEWVAPGKGVRRNALIAYVISVFPNFSTFHKGYLYIPNTVITVGSILKAYSDNFRDPAKMNLPGQALTCPGEAIDAWRKGSARFDMGMNIAWLVVITGIFARTEKQLVDIISVIGNVAYCLPPFVPLVEKDPADVFLLVEMLTAAYAAACLAAGIADWVDP
jgi:hypothetical protein